jgi:NAD-dependent deacetylase
MLVVGSSLVVKPAATLPMIARSTGAHLAVINAEPTPIDHFAAVAIQARAGAILQRLIEVVAGSWN